MNTQLRSFYFNNIYDVRVQIINSEPWFCLNDVCKALTVINSSDLLSKQLDKAGVEKIYLRSDGQRRQFAFVNEPNLYRVIFRSNKLEAKQFQDWVFNEVLPSIRKTGKYEHPQPRPEAPELLNDNDTRNLAHLVWSMANGFRFERAWTQGIWYALRHATGIASPQHFEVNQIAIIAEECRRIYGITDTLKSAIFDAEKQAIRRLLRHKENVEIVLREMQQLLEASTHEHDSVMTQSLEKWQQANVNRFLQRN